MQSGRIYQDGEKGFIIFDYAEIPVIYFAYEILL
jgi:hypothetical protein